MARNLFRGPVKAVLVELTVLLRRDDRDLIVQFAVLVHSNSSLAVRESMSMELRCLWLAGELTEPLAQQLLIVNTNVLVAEEYNTALRNY